VRRRGVVSLTRTFVPASPSTSLADGAGTVRRGLLFAGSQGGGATNSFTYRMTSFRVSRAKNFS